MAKIRIITFGCSNNLAESEMMAGLLKHEGHKIVEHGQDITIVSLCSVKGPSLNKGLREARKAEGKVILAGCIPDYALGRLRKDYGKASLISTHNLERISEAVERLLNNERVEFLEKKQQVKLCFPRYRKNSIVAIIPIASGCVSRCSYCAVKNIKGALFSYPVEKIIEEAKQSLEQGCKELWITAQDTGCYGMDIGSTLPSLLKKIMKIDGDFKVRLGMANPEFILNCLDELIGIFRDDKMFKFLHIPLQSGSDKVLGDMARGYRLKGFMRIVESFRKRFPEMVIATDMLVGYPTESRKDFEASLSAVKRIKPDILNLNRFWSMPLTPAGKLKPLPSEILKERSLRMLRCFEPIAIERNRKWIGWEGQVLIDEEGKGNTLVGRNYAYKPVIVKKGKIGDYVNVRISKATVHDLRAA